jgi:Zn-dependent protease
MAVTAIAGPLSNLVLAAVVFFFYGLVVVQLSGLESGEIVQIIIENTIYLSIALAVFNLMPIPPLDGSKVVFSLLSEENYYKLMKYERYGILVLILVLNTGLFRSTIGRLTETLFNNLIVFFRFAFYLAN